MHIVLPNQIAGNETRVALIPASVKKLIAAGHTVSVQSGAGARSAHLDRDYEEVGAIIIHSNDTRSVWGSGELLVCVQPPTDEQFNALSDGAAIVGMLDPLDHVDRMQALAARNVTALALEFLPRISRAQSMDVLSSQANIGGYKAVILAAEHCLKMFPMMITAAGTIAPSRVFVIGAGVAGLQAIATARRLGAIVEAYDVRAATREQVQSLGARFVELTDQAQDDATTGGYAREQTEEQRQKQIELMTRHVTGADCVITTAAVFGKAPPLLVPTDMVARMKPGSVVVDMAADPDHGRGNCESTRPGEIYQTENDVTIIGLNNLPGLVPVHASQMFSANLLAFLTEITGKDGSVQINLEDELHKGALITYQGELTHTLLKEKVANNGN